jgi:hypothetical protein
MSRGTKFGRKPKLIKHQRDEALARKRNGETLRRAKADAFASRMDRTPGPSLVMGETMDRIRSRLRDGR